SVASWAGSWLVDAGEGLLLDGHVGVEVDLGGFRGLVAEPEGNDRGVDSGVQQRHGGGMPKRVRGDVLRLDRWAAVLCCGCVFGDEPFDGVAREWASSLGGKQRAVRGGIELCEPGPEDLDGLPGERCCPVLATLAVTADVRAGAQVDVLAGEAGEL